MSPPHLHLLMTTDAVGGVWVYATTLARSLCERGYRVTLVSLGPPPRKDQLAGVRHIRDFDLVTTDLALEWLDPEGVDVPRARERLATIEQNVRPDIVHLNSYREASGGWSAPILVAAHSCVRSWWRACRGEEVREPRWLTYIANVRAGLAAAQRWVSPTAAFRDTIQELYDPPCAGDVIWNGIELSISPAPKQPIILAAGRVWDEAKNIATLAAVASHLAWPVRIAGPLTSCAPGIDRAEAAASLQPLGELSRRDLIEEMQRAAVFVSPAVYEPFGLTVLEAAFARCALVLADIESFRELWDGAAVFVDPRDGAMLQAVLAHLTRNEALRRDLQARAARRARRYPLSAMSDAYHGLYTLMTRQGRSTPSAPPRMLDEVRA